MKHAKDDSLTAPDEMVELTRLFDTYGELLGEKQREIFTDYVLENLSLSEISEERGITRQGVYDTLNRTRAKLRGYEEKLSLLARTDKIDDLLAEILNECDLIENRAEDNAEVESIKRYINIIREELI